MRPKRSRCLRAAVAEEEEEEEGDEEEKEEAGDKAHRYLLSASLCESAGEISGVRAIRAQPQQKGGSGQGNSFFLWPIVLPPVLKNTHRKLFHPPLCTGRNRKCLHHRLHPSSLAKRTCHIYRLLTLAANYFHRHDRLAALLASRVRTSPWLPPSPMATIKEMVRSQMFYSTRCQWSIQWHFVSCITVLEFHTEKEFLPKPKYSLSLWWPCT